MLQVEKHANLRVVPLGQGAVLGGLALPANSNIGPVYAACTVNIRFNRMDGYGSKSITGSAFQQRSRQTPTACSADRPDL